MLPKFSSRAFLAPMAGVSDPALRLQCKKMGAGLVVTEFTNIHSIIAKENQLKEKMKTIQEFIEYSDEERPLSIQLFGSDLIALEKAAKIVEPYFDIIDYNMGLSCSSYYFPNGWGCIVTRSKSYSANF